MDTSKGFSKRPMRLSKIRKQLLIDLESLGIPRTKLADISGMYGPRHNAISAAG